MNVPRLIWGPSLVTPESAGPMTLILVPGGTAVTKLTHHLVNRVSPCALDSYVFGTAAGIPIFVGNDDPQLLAL